MATLETFRSRFLPTERIWKELSIRCPLMKESLELISALPKAELLWASVREVLNIFQAADCGCHIVTVPHDILAKAIKLGGMDLGELFSTHRAHLLR